MNIRLILLFHASFAERLKPLPALVVGNGMSVVTGFIRSASRMAHHVFVPRYVFHASFAERLKPLTTCDDRWKMDVCSDRIYPVSKPDGRAYIRASLCVCMPRLLSG